MTNKTPAERFHVTMMALTNHICDMLEEKGLYGAATTTVVCTTVNAKNPVDICEEFIEKTSPHWGKIRTKDQEFFELHADVLFSAFGQKNIDKFKCLFDDNGDDNELVWKRLQSLVKISINHIHKMRCPVIRRDEPCYEKEYFNDIDLHTIASSWGELGLKALQW